MSHFDLSLDILSELLAPVVKLSKSNVNSKQILTLANVVTTPVNHVLLPGGKRGEHLRMFTPLSLYSHLISIPLENESISSTKFVTRQLKFRN